MEQYIKAILEQIDPQPNRPELINTPKRAADALKYFTQGNHVQPEDILKNSLISCSHQQLVFIKDIEFYSICEHHLLPFFGKCHIAYIPNQHLLGLSKFAEILDVFAHRLQIQENLCQQIAECLYTHLNPVGLAVRIEAQHLCMMMRGVQKQHASLVTQTLLGKLSPRDYQTIMSQFTKI
jgi:GTP cyclohydrolase I